MQYEIRPATSSDAGGIAAAHVASWQSAYRGLLPDDLLDNLSVAGRERGWSTTLARDTPGPRPGWPRTHMA